MVIERRVVRAGAVTLLLGLGCSDAAVDRVDPGPSFRATLLLSEHAVDPLAAPRPVLGRWPAVAFNKTEYLVVWEDHRATRPKLYGGRIADGTALDPFGFPILDEIGDHPPAVASDGDGFLLTLTLDDQLLGVRVSATGEVLDPSGIVIAPAGSRPALAYDGEHYLVAWAQPGSGIDWARVKPDGTVLDPGGVLAWELNASSPRAGVSFDGANYLLSFTDIDAITLDPVLRAGRIAPDGTVLDAIPINIDLTDEGIDPQHGPVAAFDGSNHVIAWMHDDVDAEPEVLRILASRVTPAGMLLDPKGRLLFEDSGDCGMDLHRLDIAAASGRSVVVSSTDFGGCESGPHAGVVHINQLAADGTVSVHPADGFTLGMESTLALQPDGGLLLWRDGDDISVNDLALTGTMLDASGVPEADQIVAPAWPASREEVTAVASARPMFFVLWKDTRDPASNGTALYGARVAADGTPLDPQPIRITDHTSAGANVVFDGANVVVTWLRWRHDSFRTVRVSLDGELLDAEPLLPPLHSSERPAGASDGTHTLLVGESYPLKLAAVLVNHDGVVISDVTEIAGKNDNYAGSPMVSFDGTHYLVVWSDWNDIAGQRLNQAGELDARGRRWPSAGRVLPVRPRSALRRLPSTARVLTTLPAIDLDVQAPTPELNHGGSPTDVVVQAH